MDRFFDEQNIARYRKLRDAGMNETQRAMILKQLAEEETTFKEQLRAGSALPPAPCSQVPSLDVLEFDVTSAPPRIGALRPGVR